MFLQLKIISAKEILNTLGLDSVPIIAKNIKLKDIMPTIDDAVKYAENVGWKVENGAVNLTPAIKETDKLWKDYFQHEGVVVRSVNYDKDSNIGFSFKVKNLAYQEKGLSNISNLCKKLIKE